ncbi:unnamed protein product [Prorocentrum cordatum]|uniref:Uncharacterized protein n=1 Tax=Prorocentrum cordatum TaxID=2364126 RepID=A0ABN9TFG5_9DINO|nr:unnamed protein product [Polarella glacialis]
MGSEETKPFLQAAGRAWGSEVECQRFWPCPRRERAPASSSRILVVRAGCTTSVLTAPGVARQQVGRKQPGAPGGRTRSAAGGLGRRSSQTGLAAWRWRRRRRAHPEGPGVVVLALLDYCPDSLP